MDDNGLPPLPQPTPASPSAPEGRGSDQTVLPPLPTPTDTVAQESSVTQEPPVAPPATEPEKPKKKSNMKWWRD
jgi:hypothetical protein